MAPGTMMWPAIVRTGSSNREISSSLFRQSRGPLPITERTRKPVSCINTWSQEVALPSPGSGPTAETGRGAPDGRHLWGRNGECISTGCYIPTTSIQQRCHVKCGQQMRFGFRNWSGPGI